MADVMDDSLEIAQASIDNSVSKSTLLSYKGGWKGKLTVVKITPYLTNPVMPFPIKK